MLFRWSGISAEVSKGDIRMMGFHEDQDPESDRMFWVIMIAMSLVAVIFIVEIFLMFCLYL